MEEGEIGNERERYKGREVEIGLDHLEVGKISGVEGSQRERGKDREGGQRMERLIGK